MRKVLFLFAIVMCYCEAANQIQSVHIALAGDPSRMVVSWLTSEPTYTSMVFYGTTPNSYPNHVSSTNQTSYDKQAGWNHNVLLTNLSPNTTYYYICGDPSWAMSDAFNFTTMQQTFTTTTIAAYGDLGIDHSADTIAQLVSRTQQGDFDLFVHMGDISYANDHPLEYEKTWQSWFTQMEPVMSKVPYMVSPGNHESWCRNPICALQTKNFTTYKEKFRMPGNESGSGTNMFYSFDFYNIHFVAISTESDYPGAPVRDPEPDPSNEVRTKYYFQENWLHDDLQKAVANRANVPFIILFGHRPIYAPTEQTDGIPNGYSAHVQSFFEPILKQYEVDIFLTGHMHSYARTYPTYNNTVTSTSFTNPPSAVHICAGGAGNREGVSKFPDSPMPAWYAAGNDDTYGYGEFQVLDQNTLMWNYYLSNTGELYDSFKLSKS